ncbi:MAG: hypothetical protein U0S50_11740 [Sphingopyxis sp.]|nr:hypothetical protein [Sphingopyxis sp.]MDZ3832474.1 hypothetical protein [Sphingopyxis sp.]
MMRRLTGLTGLVLLLTAAYKPAGDSRRDADAMAPAPPALS